MNPLVTGQPVSQAKNGGAPALLSVNLATVDPDFNPGVRFGPTYALALQIDGRILLGGVFSRVGGRSRTNLARLNPDGTLDVGFRATANSEVDALAIQADGRILVGGGFRALCGEPRRYLGRLHADGTLDRDFDPGSSGGTHVNALAIQPDGRIVVGGHFTSLGGEPRNGLGRLNADGSLDRGFAPRTRTDSWVNALALQADGKILAGGLFTVPGQAPRSEFGALVRFHPDGTLDEGFRPFQHSAQAVASLALQADGRILVGGYFSELGGQSRSNIGRLHADGTLDSDFNPSANNYVVSLAAQSDGRILMAGAFTNVNGQMRHRMARLHADGTLDPAFSPSVDGWVGALALQSDGHVLVAGQFTEVAGWAREDLARVHCIEPATESLLAGASGITWLRGGTSPELSRTTFDHSLDHITWTHLGMGSRIPGGWQLTGSPVPAGGTVRARGHQSGAFDNGSSWFVERYSGAPVIVAHPENLAAQAGTTATFRVVAGGTEPLAYRWHKDGVPLADGQRVAGATTATLSVGPVFEVDEGSYSAVVSNGYGSLASAPGTLSLIPALTARLEGGTLVLEVTGEPGQRYSLDFATTLPAPDLWRSLEAFVLTNSPQAIADPTWDNDPQRFYRLRQEP